MDEEEGDSASYTPVADDRGRYLRAMVTYTDRTYDEDNDDKTRQVMSFMNTAVSDSTTAVRNNPMNQAPSSGRVRAPSGSWKRTRWRADRRR